MCGGRLVITPCSRVGHVFRKTTPYSFPGGTSQIVDRNNGRLAAVWLDEWRSFYFAMFPGFYYIQNFTLFHHPLFTHSQQHAKIVQTTTTQSFCMFAVKIIIEYSQKKQTATSF
jgi:hypothetical protein